MLGILGGIRWYQTETAARVPIRKVAHFYHATATTLQTCGTGMERIYEARDRLTLLAAAQPQRFIALLGDGDREVRAGCALALGRARRRESIHGLIRLLRDRDPDVRRCAALSLDELGDVRGVTPLITALADADSKVRQRVADALGSLGDPSAIEPLRRMLSDPAVDREALLALARIDDPRATGVVLQVMRTPGHKLAWLAPLALSQYPKPGFAFQSRLRAARIANPRSESDRTVNRNIEDALSHQEWMAMSIISNSVESANRSAILVSAPE
jgi:hypothetical protein